MTRDTVLSIVLASIHEIVPEFEEGSYGPDDSMVDLGLNSIERQEVLLRALEVIGLDVPITQFHGPRSIGELADLLYAKYEA